MKILLTGAGGMLAHALGVRAAARGCAVAAYARHDLDVTHEADVRAAVQRERPLAVIQCAAYTRVDDAERAEAAAHDVNARGAGIVARACAELGVRFVYPSTDYVFDGSATTPYRPDAPVAPLNAYGRSKLAGERAAAAADALIVRTSWLYGPRGSSFVRTVLARVRDGIELRVVDDQRGSPTYTLDLADTILLLLERAAPAGVYHATNAGDTTWFGLATAIAAGAGERARITPVASSEFPLPACRPRYSVLDCTGTHDIAGPLPHWRAALQRAIEQGIE